MPIALAADASGFDLKEAVKAHLARAGRAVVDLTPDQHTDVPYYDAAALVATAIQRKQAERGILCCGTGMGVAIVANKFKGVYAGVVESEFAGEHCACINNTNVITLGGMVTAPPRAIRIVDAWLKTAFTAGYDEDAAFLQDALEKIRAIEAETMR